MDFPESILRILGLGVNGLAFLLAVMAYRLLVNEQRRAPIIGEPPRDHLYNQIKLFMGFSIVLCLLTFAAHFWRPLNYRFEYVGRGDFGGSDVSSTNGGKPLESLCAREQLGLTAVCWANACTYKNILSSKIEQKGNIGEVYRCTAY